MSHPVDEEKPVTVCVTGATGMLGTWTVKRFLDAGVTVKASVRDLKNAAKLRHLRELPGAAERLILFEVDHCSIRCSTVRTPLKNPLLKLSLFKADLNDVSGLESTFWENATALIHTATPLYIPLAGKDNWKKSSATGGGLSEPLSREDAERLQIKPAVEGTRDLLTAAKAAGVGIVVLTGSNAAMSGQAKFDIPKEPAQMSALDWSELDWCYEREKWYRIAKTQQERATVDFCCEQGIKLARICPDAIFGPLLTPHLNLSHALLLACLDGSIPSAPNDSIGGVDVRDVAEAHYQAYRKLSAGIELRTGRYLMSWDFWSYSQLFAFLGTAVPSMKVTAACEAIESRGFEAVPASVDCSPVEGELGITMRGPEEVLIATVIALVEKGHLDIPIDELERLRQPAMDGCIKE